MRTREKRDKGLQYEQKISQREVIEKRKVESNNKAFNHEWMGSYIFIFQNKRSLPLLQVIYMCKLFPPIHHTVGQQFSSR